MPIGDGVNSMVAGCKVWIILHQSRLAGNTRKDGWTQQVWRCWRCLSATGNGSGNKMVVDLKWLRQTTLALLLMIHALKSSHSPAQTRMMSRWCDGQQLASSRWVHNGCGKPFKCCWEETAGRFIDKQWKGFWARMNLDIPQWRLWMTTTNSFPLTAWVVPAKVSCRPLKFRSGVRLPLCCWELKYPVVDFSNRKWHQIW